MSVPRRNSTGSLFHEKPDAQSVSRSQAQDIVHVASGPGSSVEATGASRDLSRAQHPVSTPQNPRSKPSIPRVIFQSTVWIVLTIFVPLIAVAFYRDVEAEFKDHLDGPSHRSHACQISLGQAACLGPKGRVEIAVSIVGRTISAFFGALSWKSIVIILLVLFFGLGFVSARQYIAATRNVANYHAHRGGMPVVEIRAANDLTAVGGRA